MGTSWGLFVGQEFWCKLWALSLWKNPLHSHQLMPYLVKNIQNFLMAQQCSPHSCGAPGHRVGVHQHLVLQSMQGQSTSSVLLKPCPWWSLACLLPATACTELWFWSVQRGSWLVQNDDVAQEAPYLLCNHLSQHSGGLHSLLQYSSSSLAISFLSPISLWRMEKMVRIDVPWAEPILFIQSWWFALMLMVKAPVRAVVWMVFFKI